MTGHATCDVLLVATASSLRRLLHAGEAVGVRFGCAQVSPFSLSLSLSLSFALRHKRPEVLPKWGWTKEAEFVHLRTRCVLYLSTNYAGE